MNTWQKRLRAMVAIFGVGAAGVVYYAIQQAKPPSHTDGTVTRMDPNAAVESRAGQIFRFRGDKEDVVINYDSQLTYPDGRNRLTGARILVKKRMGRDFTVTAREADVAKGQESVDLRGDVKMDSSDGMKMATPHATYTQAGGVVRAEGAVAFSKPGLNGTSTGMTYKESQQWLELPADVVIHFTGDGKGSPPMDVTAGSAVFPRPDRYIRFEKGFTLVHESRTLQSDTSQAFLSDDESRVQMLEMRGHSRITGVGDAAGSLRGMSAQDINLEFAADGRTLATAVLSTDAVIDVAGGSGAPKRIAARWISLMMGPDGTTVTALTARESVRMDLPAEGAEPARVVTASNLLGKGEPGKGLTAATFTGDVEFTETRPVASGKPASKRVARSQSLDLAVTPGFGTVEDAKFTGRVRFSDSDVTASAAAAQYKVKDGVLELEGIDEKTRQRPTAADDQVSIEADHITLTLEGQKVDAKGDVRSAMRGQNGPDAAASKAKRPSMLKADQPVYATAAALLYDGAAKQARYDGSSRLWQGDTAIQGDQISLDDGTGNLTAHGKVRSTFMLEQADTKTKKTERVATIASADDLVYEEATRRATYTKSARLSGEQGDLRADKIELYLKASGNELDKVEGYEKVSLRSDSRQSTGDRLTYFAADEKYVMSGKPVRITAECRETSGKTLTFFRSVDTITVDGDEEKRTQTKSGPGCEAPRK
jgi:lipopolysaccharide export system protein LptA